MQRMVERLPLSVPVDHYHISSSFGKREDPINGRMGMHYGLDLGAVEGSRVYAPAPGKVVDAGWNGQYGRFVEIDHGMGVHTRYGHLKEALVETGDKVTYRDKIALVGNSGRSTGAHLHYEVQVDGEPVDPYNFIKAGRYVFKEQ